MPITAKCGSCGRQYKLDERFAGKRVRCRNCGQSFTVPAAAHEAPPPDELTWDDKPEAGTSAPAGDDMDLSALASLEDSGRLQPPPAAKSMFSRKPVDDINSLAPPPKSTGGSKYSDVPPDDSSGGAVKRSLARRRASSRPFYTRPGGIALIVLVVAGGGLLYFLRPQLDDAISNMTAPTSAPAPIVKAPAPRIATSEPVLPLDPTTQPTVAPFVVATPVSSEFPTTTTAIAVDDTSHSTAAFVPAHRAQSPAPKAQHETVIHLSPPLASTSQGPDWGKIERLIIAPTTAPAVVTLTRDEKTDTETLIRWETGAWQRRGEVTLNRDRNAKYVFSPGAELLARSETTPVFATQIISFESGTTITSIDSGNGRQPILMGFCGSDKLVIRSSDVAPVLSVIDARTGQKLKSFNAPQFLDGTIALSERYIAVPTDALPGPPSVVLFDIQTGGFRRLNIPQWTPGKRFVPVAMAISPDGASVALLCDDGGTATVRLWDVRESYLAITRDFPTLIATTQPPFEGKLLTFVSDNRTVILRGSAVVDLNSGRVLGQLGIDHAAEIAPVGDDRYLVRLIGPDQATEVAQLDIAAIRSHAAAAVAAGPFPVLPPSNEWALNISPKEDLGQVPMKIQPEAPIPHTSPVASTIDLGPMPELLRGTYFARPDASLAIVVHGPELARAWDFDDPLHEWVERIALDGGKPPVAANLPPRTTVLNASPDGAFAILASATDPASGRNDRVDLWSLADCHSIINWIPYGSAESMLRPVLWAAMPDRNIIVTLNNNGTLIGWNIAAHHGLWAWTGVVGYPFVSPQDKHIVAKINGRLRFLDVITGNPAGDLEPLSDGGFVPLAAAFSVDGAKFAAVGANAIVVWDMTTGQVITSLNGSGAGGVQFCGNRYVLAGDRLYDLQQQGSVFSYPVANGKHLWGGPITGDPSHGQHWFIEYPSDDAALLSNAAVPSEEDLQVITAFRAHPPLIHPGAGVGIAVDVDDRPDAALTHLIAKVRGMGMDVYGSQPVAVVRVTAKKVDTGDRVQLCLAGSPPPGGGWPVVKVMAWECDYQVQDMAGKVILVGDKTEIVGGSGTASALRIGQSLQDRYNEAFDNSMLSWIDNIQIPRYLATDGTSPGEPQSSLIAPVNNH